jgi:2-polyprenyl-3-methyl-5-hydroxy-6-metoxy-1,4-benzoquinol methylase
MTQREHSEANRKAWSHRAYEATLQLGGTPKDVAETLVRDPEHTLRDYLEFLGDVKGKRVANLLGSSGKKAIALALLGAEVTVVDIARDNQRFALECAGAAGVSIEYVVSDVLAWDAASYANYFDLVLTEYGILHYFVDLHPLAQLACDILQPEGRWVLHEFHPLIRKFTPRKDRDQLVLKGDYFSNAVVERPAPRATAAFPPDELEFFPLGRYRYWQMGEIVSAACAQGLQVETLREHPHTEWPALPGTFTLVTKK